jgi:SAM-dependent methyltransferase
LVGDVHKAVREPKTKETASFIKDRSSRYVLRESCPMSKIGVSYLDTLFLNRFRSKTSRFPPLVEASEDSGLILRVAVHLLKRGDKVTPASVLSNLKFLSRTPGHFFPMAACSVWKKYVMPGLPVLDPFLGWGGRTMGALCADVHRIVGCDLQDETVEACRQLAVDFSQSSSSISEFHNADALKFMRSTDEKFGVIFSSPPYSDSEDYGVESDAMGDDWLDSFVIPFVSECRRILAPGGVVALHLKDISGAPTFTAYHSSLISSGFRRVASHRYGGTWTQSVHVYES